MKLVRGNVLEAYTDYLNKYEKGHKLFLTRIQFNDVIRSIGEELAYVLITTGEAISIPSKLGYLQVVKYLQKEKQVDFHKTRELYEEYNKLNPLNKKAVYHTNRITKGTVPKLYWSKLYKANFKNKTKFSFKFTRPNMRPNSYNKTNPRVSLYPFFKEQGFRLYSVYNPRNQNN